MSTKTDAKKTTAPRTRQTRAERRVAGVPQPIVVESQTTTDLPPEPETVAGKKTAPAPAKPDVVKNDETKPLHPLTGYIKEHARKYSADGGWDTLLETWSDEDISNALGRARTEYGARCKVWPFVRAQREMIKNYETEMADAS